MKWVEWIEPFGPNSEPVYLSCPATTAVAVMMQTHPYESDQEALDDFIAVYWATVKL